MDTEKVIVIPLGDYQGIKFARDIPGLDIDDNIRVSAVNRLINNEITVTGFPIKFDEALSLISKAPTLEELNNWIKQTPTAAIEHQRIVQILRDKGLFILHDEDKVFEDKLLKKLYIVNKGKVGKTSANGLKELLQNCSETMTIFDAVEKTSSEEKKHRNVYIKALNKDLRGLIKNDVIAIYGA
jgi:hypothetical protein